MTKVGYQLHNLGFKKAKNLDRQFEQPFRIGILKTKHHKLGFVESKETYSIL